MPKQMENCHAETQATAVSSDPQSVRDRLARIRAAVAGECSTGSAPVSEFADKAGPKRSAPVRQFADS